MIRRDAVAIATIAVLSATVGTAQEWYHQDPATPPPARRFHALGYDEARAATVLFGGADERAGTVFGDTWEYDGARWQRRAQDGVPARQRFAAAFDRARGRFVVFGGIGQDGAVRGDTWEWDGSSWIPVLTTQAPAPRADAALAFDEVRRVLVLFGGRPADPQQPFADTWEYDGVTWTPRTPAGAPAARFGHAMAFDTARGVTLLFGGFAGGSGTRSDTFAYDGATWRPVATATTPPAFVFPALTCHRAHGVVVLTGGSGAASQPLQTFVFDGSDWQAGPGAALGQTSRQGHAAAYDDAREAVVLFGGATIALGGARPLADTWELSVPAAFAAFGQGCATSVGPFQLTAAAGAAPELGRDFTLTAGPRPAGTTPLLLLGASDRSFGGVPLPLGLAPFGMPGCVLLTSVDVVASMIPQGASSHAVLAIPLDRRLLGQELFAQVLVSGSENATSNAGRLRVGN